MRNQMILLGITLLLFALWSCDKADGVVSTKTFEVGDVWLVNKTDGRQVVVANPGGIAATSPHSFEIDHFEEGRECRLAKNARVAIIGIENNLLHLHTIYEGADFNLLYHRCPRGARFLATEEMFSDMAHHSEQAWARSIEERRAIVDQLTGQSGPSQEGVPESR